ncbi:alpha/beta-hydrolase [Roridomyces roridus]|uniref:Carboxylic ester hydrolase n=1 Tax=Roridomyces roridus TaxID=1738132 RepID=A0AAD7BQD0_9AGAR|nr:alpha/beta-hydrolase [Roridomyces roridus]
MVVFRVVLALLAVLTCVTSAPRSAAPPQDISVLTPLGTAQGTLDADGANRFAVRYAGATRWQSSAVVTEWTLPNGASDPAALPLQCPQTSVDASTFAEDCLSMILYVPVDIAPGSNASTLVWIHGGSFDSGSATFPGLDGSNLAIATESIVAVIQYRLGALGLLPPDGSTNLAVQDAINALIFLGQVVPSFGGDSSKITLAGQSAGAGMIRSLLAAPSASSLFQSAILQSDPMDFGFTSLTTQALLQSTFNDLISCSPSDTACQMSLTLDDILSAQATLEDEALGLDPSVAIGEPLHPVLDHTLITTPLDSTAPFPKVSKPLLLTNVRNESAPTIYGVEFPGPGPFPAEDFELSSDALLGTARTEILMASPFYPVDPNGDSRVPLQVLGTDYIWRCPTWTFARNWVANGGTAHVGMFTVGATYPLNDGIDDCVAPGAVCHQDDIFIVFGTTPNPTPAQSALTTEMQARYKAFLASADPNEPGLDGWVPATTTDVHAKEFGVLTTVDGEVPVLACDPSFWGQAVQYDYQFFDL